MLMTRLSRSVEDWDYHLGFVSHISKRGRKGKTERGTARSTRFGKFWTCRTEEEVAPSSVQKTGGYGNASR